MAALDGLFRDLAVNLLRDFGAAGTLQRVTRVFTVASGTTVETVTPYAVLLAPPTPVAQRLVDGTTVLASDFMTTIAAKGIVFTPEAGNVRLVFAGTTWQVVQVHALYSGDLVAAYEMVVRR